VTEIVCHTDRFNKRVVRSGSICERSADLSALEGVSHPGSEDVSVTRTDYLRLTLQASKGPGVKQPIPVMFEG
jgi:hypothetical protein